MKIAVVGAGSVGIHYARAWSKAGEQVLVFDVSSDAIARFDNIWESRYPGSPRSKILMTASWSDVVAFEPEGIVIGTPPDSHLEILKQSLREIQPKFIEVQKPFVPPILGELEELTEIWLKLSSSFETQLISGFNHSYSNSFRSLRHLAMGARKLPESIEVIWQESWSGPLAAHSWLKSVKDSYLGFTKRGGGASMEHSHGLEMGMRLWLELGLDCFDEVSSEFEFDATGDVDHFFKFSATTKNCRLNVVQSALDQPSRKLVKVKFHDGESLELEFSALEDKLTLTRDGYVDTILYAKTREEDFDAEVRAIKMHLWRQGKQSPLGELSIRPGLLANHYLGSEYSINQKSDENLGAFHYPLGTIEKVWG